MKQHNRLFRWVSATAMISAALMLSACSGTHAEPGATTNTSTAVRETVGPNGEAATPVDDIQITAEQIAEVAEGARTAAIMWPESSSFFSAVAAGVTDTFAEMGIEVVSVTDSAFDPATERANLEAVLALKPDVIVTLIVDPVASAETFQLALDAGVKLVLLSNLPEGFEQGKDYVSLVTDDLFAMGEQSAIALADAMGGEGKVGFIYYDANFYVTNQREQAFKTVITEDYPNIEIVAEAGMGDPSKVQEVADAMIAQHPDLNGIFAPWAPPADDVLASLRTAGRSDVKLVTMNLSAPLSLDMIAGGNTVAMVADEAYKIGQGLARAYALDVVGAEVPAFIVAPAITATKDNLVEVWEASLNEEPPAEVLKALK